MTIRLHVSFIFMEEHAMKNLKHHAAMAGLLGAGALLLAAAPAVAGRYDGHPDLEHSILNDLDRPAYVGTGLETRARVRVYPTSAAFPNPDIDQTGFATGMAGPEEGVGDMQGSILYDVGALRE
jgi:hypothetical protein